MKEDNFIQELMNGLNMGIIAIEHLFDKIDSQRLKDIVHGQKKNYEDLLNRIHHHYPNMDEDKVKNKFMLETMVEMKSLMSDDSKIAKMLIEGSLQSVMTMTHLLNKEENADLITKEFANDFEDISKRYIEELKEFI